MTMKKSAVLLVFILTGWAVYAQESLQQVMEKRAREMHRVIGLSDRAQWKKFISENYSQALIDKPMRSQVSTNDPSGPTTEKKTIGDNLEGKVDMFERLHSDFGESKIVSLKADGEKLVMELGSADLNGTFNLKFGATKPYLIESLGIQIERGN